jgi:hypothetical protein
MGARFDVAKVGPLLEAAHERLTGVVIEHLPGATSSPATTAPAPCSTSTRPTTAARKTTAPPCSTAPVHRHGRPAAHPQRPLHPLPQRPPRSTPHLRRLHHHPGPRPLHGRRHGPEQDRR